MSIASCESFLAKMYGKKHCILTGNGTAALWIASLLMDESKEKVLLPAIICPNLVYAVKMAGKKPVFADVLTSDATLDPECVEKSLASDSSIGAIIAVHLYGHSADMQRLKEITDRYQVLLIEDVAQAMGGVGADGQLLGSVGDCSVLSFGPTKIIEAGEGGALITDNDDLANRARLIAGELGPPKINMENYLSIYKKLYYSIYDAGCQDGRFFSLFNKFADLFRDMYLFSIKKQTADSIKMTLGHLDNEILHRQKISTIYFDKLKHVSEITLFSPIGNVVSWRFSFCVNTDIRQDLLDTIRSQGFDASSWYPCIANWYDPKGMAENKYPVANQIEKQIVNIWVSQNYSIERADNLADTIVEFFQ